MNATFIVAAFAVEGDGRPESMIKLIFKVIRPSQIAVKKNQFYQTAAYMN
jgi:hypothetical protein